MKALLEALIVHLVRVSTNLPLITLNLNKYMLQKYKTVTSPFEHVVHFENVKTAVQLGIHSCKT